MRADTNTEGKAKFRVAGTPMAYSRLTMVRVGAMSRRAMVTGMGRKWYRTR